MNTIMIKFAINWGWILGIIIVFAALWLIVNAINSNRSPNRTNKSALDALKERYAKGLITRAEFEEKRSAIL
jgi:putative membrane protein